MEISRNKARVLAMNVLYQINLYDKNKIEYELDDVIGKCLEEDNEFVSSLVKGTLDNIVMIDNLANKYLNNWKLERLGFVDQAIIRIGIYEILFTDTPNKVCIDEAVEMAKGYSDCAVVKMINGVLDKVYHIECGEE